MNQTTPQQSRRLVSRLGKFLREQRGLIVFLCLMAVFRSSFADWNDVPTGSMRPTIVEGDRIVIDKRAYDLRIPFTHLSIWQQGDPQRGDIVVFDSERAGMRLVKRLIGLPGDVVMLRGNRVFVNGQEARLSATGSNPEGTLADEALPGRTHAVQLARFAGPRADFGPVEVPEDHYFMLGDNRDNSMDSRWYGFVPRAEIVGRAHHVAFSLDSTRYLKPRGERAWLPL